MKRTVTEKDGTIAVCSAADGPQGDGRSLRVFTANESTFYPSMSTNYKL